MKTLTKTMTTLLLLSTLSAHAAYRVNLASDGGEIRHGSLLGDAVFSSFTSELEVKLARMGVGISYSRYVDADVTYDYAFNPETFYSLNHRAVIDGAVTLKKKDISVPFIIHCGALVQDGGNQTLKMSCVRKLAKKIKSILKSNEL